MSSKLYSICQFKTGKMYGVGFVLVHHLLTQKHYSDTDCPIVPLSKTESTRFDLSEWIRDRDSGLPKMFGGSYPMCAKVIQYTRRVNVLILGGAGFIGSHLTNSLAINPNFDVFVFDNFSMGNSLGESFNRNNIFEEDIRDSIALKKALNEVGPDLIIHLAANSDIKAAINNPFLDFNDTFGTTSSLVCAIPRNLNPRIIFSSSSAIFGNSNTPLNEEAVTRPISLYGKMKLSSEIILEDSFKCEIVSDLLLLRFPNVVGERPTHGVLFDLSTKILQNPERLEVLGDGNQEKPYMYVGDLVQVIQKVIYRNNNEVFKLNIGPSDTIKVREIVSILCAELKVNPQVFYQEGKLGWIGDVPRYKFDTSKFRKLFPDIDIRSSRDAIKLASNWICKEINNKNWSNLKSGSP